ncbi:hypothetical protein [Microbacterium sp.]|uniref:hypothetical protein n=1 Tax=Microbacterium sp. TaxID=51671 RepID=UPI0033402B28
MTRGWREAGGWAAALAIALAVVAQVASTARAGLLFRDGDSLIVALFTRSLFEGQPQDWAFSSVLFIPEVAVFALLRATLPWLAVDGLLAVSAVVNVLALYGALRLAAGRSTPGRAPVAWALLATGAFGLLAVTETSSSRDAFEPASLLLTTTYYSATVIAMLVSAGLVGRTVEHPRRASVIALGAVAAISTLSNPLYAAWTTAPLALLLAARLLRRTTGALAPLLALCGGSFIGFLLRIPLSAWIANSGAGYANPSQWGVALGYYGGLLAERVSSPGGILSAVFVLGMVALCVARTRRGVGGARLIAAAGWLIPLVVVVGAIALGTHAGRYLQPVVFAPLLGLVASPRTVRIPRIVVRTVAAACGAVLLVLSAISIPRLSGAAAAEDRDLDCVTSWVSSSGRIGGGQFWTVRLPKLHLPDPSRLVQVDHALNGYAWLVNRTDFAAGELTFLVQDAQSTPWALPGGAAADVTISCGRYTILDFASHPLRIGPQRS